MYKNRKVTVIIPAAGSGRRMGGPVNKVFMDLLGKPVLSRTVEAFEGHEGVDEIIIAVRADERDFCLENVIRPGDHPKVSAVIAGGAERYDTVLNCLEAADENSIVLIHDGARPLVDEETISAVIEAVDEHGYCCAAVPVKDTIKIVSNGAVSSTPDRSLLWAAQTPQGFFCGEIKGLIKKSLKEGYFGTDEAGFAEKQGKKVFIVSSKYDNIKITTSEDLIIAEAILMKRKEKQCTQE